KRVFLRGSGRVCFHLPYFFKIVAVQASFYFKAVAMIAGSDIPVNIHGILPVQGLEARERGFGGETDRGGSSDRTKGRKAVVTDLIGKMSGIACKALFRR